MNFSLVLVRFFLNFDCFNRRIWTNYWNGRIKQIPGIITPLNFNDERLTEKHKNATLEFWCACDENNIFYSDLKSNITFNDIVHQNISSSIMHIPGGLTHVWIPLANTMPSMWYFLFPWF